MVHGITIELEFAQAMSHAVQWLNTARRVLAHVRAYLDSGQYGERRDNEQACLRVCRHGEYCVNLKFGIYFSLSRSSTQMDTSPHAGQIATLGSPILPPKSLFSSDDITIPYPAPLILMAQFSFISLPHRMHFLTNIPPKNSNFHLQS